jgi:predicted ferric reductase
MAFDGSNDPGFALVHGMWAANAIAAVILILRVFAKIKLRQFRFDDVLMVVAWVLRSHSSFSRSRC